MENKNTPPNRKSISLRDIILIALAILVMTRIEWANMNSFHYLIFFMLILCFMLRWSNMRKDALRQQKIAEYKAAMEAKQAAEQQESATSEDIIADPVSTTDMTTDTDSVDTSIETEQEQ